MLGYSLTDIILNLQSHHLAKFIHPSRYDPFGKERLDGFIEKKDLGYLFCALSFSFGQTKGENLKERIEEALTLLGMPSYEEIQQDFKDFWKPPSKIIKKLSHEALVPLRFNLTMSGVGLVHTRNPLSSVPVTALQYISSGAQLPIIMTGDCEIISFNEFSMSESDHDILYKLADRLDFHTKNSLRAARGYDFNWGDYTY